MIRINAGGQHFTTLRQTLLSGGGRFAALLDDNVLRDETGAPFVDRDPHNFRHLLNLVRNAHQPLIEKLPASLLPDALYMNMTSPLPFIYKQNDYVILHMEGQEHGATVRFMRLRTVTLEYNDAMITYSHDVWDPNEQIFIHERASHTIHANNI